VKEFDNARSDDPVQIPLHIASGNSNSTSELFQRRWFCVGLFNSGQTSKQDADSPMPFLDIINRSSISWVDYITDDPMGDLAAAAAQMGFSEPFITSMSTEAQLSYQDFDTEMWMKFPSIQIRQTNVMALPLLVLIRKNIVFTIHTSLVDKRFIRLRRYSDIILRKISLDISMEDKVTVLLSRILDANNDSNFRHLRVIEELGDDLNNDLMSTKTNREQLGPKIYQMKHALITYMNSLWDCVDVLHALRYGDAELITNDERLLDLVSVMIDEVKGQIGLAEHMSEVLASGLEVMQSIYNNQLQILNNRFSMVITYLTVIGTAVLVPNTLATIFGNSAFNMGPQDIWWYVILLVTSTVISTYLMWWWMKRRGYLPKKPE
jgi:magnesium transporter